MSLPVGRTQQVPLDCNTSTHQDEQVRHTAITFCSLNFPKISRKIALYSVLQCSLNLKRVTTEGDLNVESYPRLVTCRYVRILAQVQEHISLQWPEEFHVAQASFSQVIKPRTLVERLAVGASVSPWHSQKASGDPNKLTTKSLNIPFASFQSVVLRRASITCLILSTFPGSVEVPAFPSRRCRTPQTEAPPSPFSA